MSNLRISIGGDGPVIAQSDAAGWRLIVRGHVHASGADNDELHVALRALALSDRDLARDAFAVVVNCMGSREDDYTKIHDEDALTFENWVERLETGLRTPVDA